MRRAQVPIVHAEVSAPPVRARHSVEATQLQLAARTSLSAPLRPLTGPDLYVGSRGNARLFDADRAPMTDAEGLDQAYAQESGVYRHGSVLYVAGTKNLRDVFDDLKIPFKMTGRAARFQNAARLYNSHIHTVVGHSLGGAVALELQHAHPELVTRTYGAPVFELPGFGRARSRTPPPRRREAVEDTPPQSVRYRHPFDPIAALDFGAQTVPQSPLANPHRYTGFPEPPPPAL